MYILAFETSCDDTSIAIFKDSELLAMDTKSQIKEHLPTCWVVPEVAARLHANNVFLVLETVLSKAQINLEEIDYIACTERPWLQPSLYVWLTVAQTLSRLLNKPFLLINHIQAHIFANLLERKLEDINFPSICLTVSWWHNEIYILKSLFDMELIWQTQDDSAWEAFDKVAKMMWVWFPGWPMISKLASEYKWAFRWIFPRVLLEKWSLDFSFSWLKSAVKREIDRRIAENKKNNTANEPNEINIDDSWISEILPNKLKYSQDIEWANKYLTQEDKTEIAFEFQETVIDILSTKLFSAAEKFSIRSLALAGWVSANESLKSKISKMAIEKGCTFVHPIKPVYSQDNAAMVGILAYYKIISDNY
ncbi:MAG: hypothetical protein ACD_2C00241G0006 [uncultured bacterium (gcode 4)]|uniref:N(6)-L-threonylcarbamoyladenine synthase n=1 Tax=uncultured bacterium (gcode 4) TaxID=1234023 RepID=K2G1H4_9BACT|nr:MAG: hypothetical protein ACD_2C00241G0006 [uncultured bacterium (gcode 4)]